MTEDNSHCTKTAHVKREGRESEEGEKKKKGKARGKKLKSHTTSGRAAWMGAARRCSGMRRNARRSWCQPASHTHIHTFLGCKNSPLLTNSPYPAPSEKQGASKHQGHPLEQHQARRQVDGHCVALSRCPSPGTVS